MSKLKRKRKDWRNNFDTALGPLAQARGYRGEPGAGGGYFSRRMSW